MIPEVRYTKGKPCETDLDGEPAKPNANICVAEGCYDESCVEFIDLDKAEQQEKWRRTMSRLRNEHIE